MPNLIINADAEYYNPDARYNLEKEENKFVVQPCIERSPCK